MHRRLTVAAVAVTAVAGLAGCSTVSTAPTSGGTHSKTIAFVTGQINEPFYVVMQKGAQAKADQLGVKLNYQGATVWDPSAQIPIFDSVRATNPGFLIAVPDDETALLGSIQSYTQAGIPTMTVDTDLADKSARMLNISSDNLQGGIVAAKTLAAAVGDKGKVAILCYQPGITVNDQRLQGFESEIKKHPGIDYVGPQLMQGADPTESVRYFDAVLQAHPDIAGVVTCADVATSGVMTSLKEKGLVGKVKLVGFDVDDDLVSGVKDGVVSALIVQQTEKLGADAVQWAYDYMNGKNPSKKDVRLAFKVVDKKNIDSSDVAELIGK
jgi:ribose transport system substrate-binding protein